MGLFIVYNVEYFWVIYARNINNILQEKNFVDLVYNFLSDFMFIRSHEKRLSFFM